MNIIEKDTKIVGTGKDIIFANGKYYLVSQSPAKICYSENLENWEEILLNEDYLGPTDLAYGNGIFVLVGKSGKTKDTYIYYSADGMNWIPKKLSTGVSISVSSFSVKFINNKFIIESGVYYKNSQGIRYKTQKWFFESKNGIDWIKHELVYNGPKAVDSYDIHYSNGIYVCVGGSGSIFTSTNLDNWVERESGVNDILVGITFGKGQFIVVGDNGTILTSNDGINWSKQQSNTNSYLRKSRYANGLYIIVGYNGVILKSTDGINWLNISNKNEGLRYGLCVNENRFVISATTYNKTGTIPIYYFDVTREISQNDDDSLFFFSKNLEMLGIVDSFISLRWRRKYFESGEFEIVLPVDKYIMNFLDLDVIVMRNNYTEAGIIETIQFDDDGDNEELTISGRFLSSLIERRIVKNRINFSGNSVEAMNTLVNTMTPLTSLWETVVSTFNSRHIDFQCTYKNVYEYLCKLSRYSGVGFRVVANVDSKVFMFETYQGVDRSADQTENTQYSFSDDFYNIENGSLVISSKSKVNYVLVGGQGEDSDRIMQEIKTDATGFDLYEIFDDQKNLSKDNISDNEYKLKLKTEGESKLNNGTLKFEVTALALDDYKKSWNLGDIVNIKKDKWNIYTKYRIVEVEETIEDGKKTIYPTFGNIEETSWVEETSLEGDE